MMSKWKRKRIVFEKNKCKKRMRLLCRWNKKRYHNSIGRKQRDIQYSMATSRILREKEFYYRSFNDYILRKTGGRVLVTIPKDFSIATNPNEVIYILKKIFYYGMDLKVREIVFDHSKCTNLGIAASTIMDTVVLAAKSYRTSISKDNELIISGNYPLDEYTKDVFIGSGLVRHLNLHTKERKIEDEVKRFKLVSGKYGTEQSSVIATKMTQYFNQCLVTQKYELTEEGENRLGKMFGEVLENCEKHGGTQAVWYALGHYQMRDSSKYGEIQLTIFNFGDSIFEQLQGKETTKEIKMILEMVTNKHEKYFSSKWTKEMLFTVLSLQEGISRLRDSNRVGYRNRGTGTITLMDTFYRLGHTMDGKEPELEIVSGHTYIKFDGKCKLEKKIFDDDIFGRKERRIIAFNHENDIYKPADGNVELLDEYFPGTIIAMKFYLDKKYLNALLGEARNE